MARFISPSISRRASVISRCSNYPVFTSLANHLAKLSVHAPFPHAHCSSRSFNMSERYQSRFSTRHNCISADFPNAVLWQRRNHCSHVENTVAPQKTLFIRNNLSFPRRFITFKQASLATNLMTRRCRVFASPFLRLLSLKGYVELFRSAAHLFLPLKSSSSVPARESSVYRFLPEL